MMNSKSNFHGRGSPSAASSSSSSSSSSYYPSWFFRSRRLTPLTVAVYAIFLFAISILLFVFNTGRILEDDSSSFPFFPRESSIAEEDSLLLASDQASDSAGLWDPPATRGLGPCLTPTAKYKAAAEVLDRYLTVRSNGGLNQMRTGIADMVAVARIMNATLVIPQLDKRSFWQDTSTFADIFDEVHFITSLKGDVRVVTELPKDLQTIPHARKHFTSWGSMGYYEEMAHIWNDFQVVHAPKSDSRLANNYLPLDIQRLRCRALYDALRFSPPIESFGKKLVERLRSRGEKYIALHLRYEKDMLSFTGCTYGLTKTESEELRIMREKTNHWKVKNMNSTEQRIEGLCPLTPGEVGTFLEALGYPPSTVVYIAAGEIYGGETHLQDLRSRFPNIVFKEALATEEELKPFASHGSQTAALDYIVSVESDVFVPSYSGNMARVVEGHRRFLGHRKTINPDRKGLVELFDKLDRGDVKEESLPLLVQDMHKNRQGGPRKRKGAASGIKGRARFKTEESFYQNPYPECICKSI